MKSTWQHVHLSKGHAVVDLEDFIKSELAKTLHRVTEERRRPAFAQFSDTGFGQWHAETLDDAAVLGRIDLDTTFDQIQRNDSRVGGAAAQDATEAAECKVFTRSKRTAVFLHVRCNSQRYTNFTKNISVSD